MHADFILRGGRIAILDRDERVVSALAARDGRIVALGSDAEVSALRGEDTAVFDLAGRTAIPGIIDSHCHPDAYAARVARWHDLSPRNVAAKEALLAMIDRTTQRTPPGTWFAGYRYDEIMRLSEVVDVADE